MTLAFLRLTVGKKALLTAGLFWLGTWVITPQLTYAQTAAQQLSPADEDRLNNLLEQGRDLVQAGKVADALAVYQQAVQLAPDNARIYSAIGFLEARQSNFEAAVNAYQQAINLDANNPDFHYALGFSKANLGDYQGAAEAYRRTTQLRRNDVEAYLGLGVVLSRLGDYEGAIAAYKQVLASNPNNGQLYESIGSAYLQEKRYREANDSLTRAAQLLPRSSTVQLNLGVARLNLEIGRAHV